MISLSADVGGTFTDFVLVNSASHEIFVDKVASTPRSSRAITEGIRRILEQAGLKEKDVERFVHGFTIATNAFLTRRGARLALVVTEGFRDVLEIGTQRRANIYSLTCGKVNPLIPRSQVSEVRERIDAFGGIVVPLAASEADAVAKRVAAMNPEAVAISLLFAHLNSLHEERLAKAVRSYLPDKPIYLSSRINPQAEEFERTNTTVTAAYVGPPVDTYLMELERTLPKAGLDAPLLLMRSDGGIATPRAARANPGNMLLSGPAGGVIASVALGKRLGVTNIVTFDMGGTSADFSLIDNGVVRKATGRTVGGDVLRLPSLDIETISAGGGSIGWVDIGGAIHVGPDSAGAAPGPACYGRGGIKPTLTDAALVLGILNATDYLGGEMSLDLEKARHSIESDVGRPTGLSVEEAAFGMVRIANAQMAEAIRGLSLARGQDPRNFALLSFGGAGSMFAPFLARDLGMSEIIVPPRPGVFCALGLQLCDIRHIAQTPFLRPLGAVDWTELEAKLEKMRRTLNQTLEKDHVASADRVFRYAADMRYVGQFHELTLPLAESNDSQQLDLSSMASAFHRAHELAHGFADPSAPCEMVNLRVEAIGVMPKPNFDETPRQRDENGDIGPADTREVYLEGHYQHCRIYRRDQLALGECIAGPAIVTQRDTTTLILSGQAARIETGGVIRIAATGG